MNLQKISSIAEFIRNGKSIKQCDNTSGLPITRIETISHGSINPDKVGFANLQKTGNENWLLEQGDILISHINSSKHLGKCAIYEGNPKELIHGMNLLNLRCNFQLACPRYIFYALNSNYFKNQIPKITKDSVNQSSFTVTSFKELTIPLPPLEEQKRIAAILDKADRVRRKRQETIRLTEELGRSIFLDMFGDPVRNPKGWEIKKLSTIFSKSPQIGIIKPAHADGNYPVIRVGEIGNREVNLEKCGRVTISAQEIEKFRCNSGDILLARAIGSESHLGKASMLQETNQVILFDSHVMRLRFDSNIMLPDFFLQWLTTQGGRHLFMKKAGRTAVQFNVNGKQISSIDIPLPPIHKQREFSRIYSKLMNSLSKSENVQELNNNLFNSLLQRAFRGEL